MNLNSILKQDSIQGALVMVLVGIFGSGLAYAEVISVDAYYWLVLVLAGVVIFGVQAVRFNRRPAR